VNWIVVAALAASRSCGARREGRRRIVGPRLGAGCLPERDVKVKAAALLSGGLDSPTLAAVRSAS
jgi:hypothetical protein